MERHIEEAAALEQRRHGAGMAGTAKNEEGPLAVLTQFHDTHKTKVKEEKRIAWLDGKFKAVGAIVYVVLHRPSAYQSSSPSRMWAGGLMLTDYRPYAFLHSLFCRDIDQVLG